MAIQTGVSYDSSYNKGAKDPVRRAPGRVGNTTQKASTGMQVKKSTYRAQGAQTGSGAPQGYKGPSYGSKYLNKNKKSLK